MFDLLWLRQITWEITVAVTKHPDESFGYFIRGNTKYNLGDYEGALNDLNKAIAIQPDNAKYSGFLQWLQKINWSKI